MTRVDAMIRRQRDYLRSHREFVNTRAQAEESARRLLNAKAGGFAVKDAEAFLDACNTERLVRHPSIFDMSDGPRLTRFGPAFVRRNRQQMLSDLSTFNRWLLRLWEAPAGQIDSALDQFWMAREIKGASRGLPTMIAYLRDPDANMVWLPYLTKGVIFLEKENLSLAPRLRHYSAYRSLVNRAVRARYQLKPQELDYVLFCTAGMANDEEP